MGVDVIKRGAPITATAGMELPLSEWEEAAGGVDSWARRGIGIGHVGCKTSIEKRCWLGSWVFESGSWRQKCGSCQQRPCLNS